MSKVGEHYRELEEMGFIGGYEDSPETPEERSARKAIKKAAKKRNKRKTSHPFGF